MDNIKIHPLSDRDIEAMKNVHIAAFPDRALSFLGDSVVTSYYRILLAHQKFCLRIGAYDGSQLVGFLVGGEMNGITRTFVQKNFHRLALHVVTHPWLLTKPIVRDRIYLTLKMLRSRKPFSKPLTTRNARPQKTFSILVIAVNPVSQSRGVGKRLMLYAEQVAAEHGYHRMHLSVDMKNVNAIGFYEHLNWTRHHPDRWSGSMMKPLLHGEIHQAAPKAQGRLDGLSSSD